MAEDSRESRDAARLAAIVQSSDDAIVSKTLNGVITSWNPSAEKLFGYTQEEAIGQHISLIIPHDRLAEEDEIIKRVRRGEAIEHFETVRRTKGGQLVDISLTVSPIKDATGVVIGASKIARDLSDRRRAEVERARLAAIVDSAEDAIISKRLDGTIQTWNRGAERIFGYTAAEAVGRHITLIIPSERHAEEAQILARIARGEVIEHFETVRQTKNGQLVDISLTVSPIKAADGTVVGASKIARDISERRRADRERAELFARAEAARDEAESLNRAKDQFLALLSHELRTPLNAVFGWSRVLLESKTDASTRTRAAEAIARNAKAQLQLVEDLLDVSRIITGNMRLEVQNVNLKPVVEAALDTIRPAAAAKDITLQSFLDAQTGHVLAAPDRMQQVVWNILMNAVKFTPKGGRVQVVLRRVNSQVEIVVSDNGEGISADVLPFVFDRFRQADSTSTRSHGGLGIGLSLVRHLVDLHGGRVTAESPGLGRGATFTVALPVALAGPASRTVEDGMGLSPSLGGLRILVVDDDTDGLDLARTILTAASAEVRTCASAAAAREILKRWDADVMLTDIEMPGEDGYALLASLREQGVRTPAIALTAYGRGEDRRRALAAGFGLHLVKPVDPAELTIAVKNLATRYR